MPEQTTAKSKRDRNLAGRRLMILDAALRCFVENGYHQTGVRDIAQRAGVSLGNLYNHFQGKHDVLAEIATLERTELQPFLTMLAQPGPVRENLEEFIGKYLRYLATKENVTLALEITCEANRKADIAEMFLGNRQEVVAALQRLIERGVDEGTFRPTPAPLETAYLILELIEGSAYRCVFDDVPPERVLPSLTDFALNALGAGA